MKNTQFNIEDAAKIIINKMNKEELKGKCTNCGKPMKDESNENWQVYCPRKKCLEAFMKTFTG